MFFADPPSLSHLHWFAWTHKGGNWSAKRMTFVFQKPWGLLCLCIFFHFSKRMEDFVHNCQVVDVTQSLWVKRGYLKHSWDIENRSKSVDHMAFLLTHGSVTLGASWSTICHWRSQIRDGSNSLPQLCLLSTSTISKKAPKTCQVLAWSTAS